MRVLLISHTCRSRLEGQPRAQQLARMPDIDLHVLVPDRWKEYGRWRELEQPTGDDFGFTVGKVRLPWTGLCQWYLHHYAGLADLLRKFRPDVIDLWEEPWGAVSAQTVWLRNKLLPAAKIVTETEQNVEKHLPPPFEQMRSYTLANANYAVGRNPEAVEILRRKGFRGPAQVIPNAVDMDLFVPMDRDACRAELGLTDSAPGTFWAGYVGRFVEQKGLADLLSALALCPPNFKLVLVGEGEFESHLRATVTSLNLGDRVVFRPPVNLQGVPAVMNALDALVLPSRTTSTWKEQFGRVIIEAHACGTPVIGSDSGAIPHVVGDGGLTFPEGNTVELASAMRALASDPELRRSLGAAGQRQVDRTYTWTGVAEQYHAIFNQLVNPTPAVAMA